MVAAVPPAAKLARTARRKRRFHSQGARVPPLQMQAARRLTLRTLTIQNRAWPPILPKGLVVSVPWRVY